MERRLGAASYSWLFHGDVIEALDGVAATGAHLVELTATAPQLDLSTPVDSQLLDRIVRAFESHELEPLSLNPTYLDINLCSLNKGFRSESVKQLINGVRACADMGIPILVLFPGRRHVLAPAPMDSSRDALAAGLEPLLAEAEKRGVVIGLENGPTNFLDRASDVAEMCAAIGNPHLRAVFDVANARMVEDPTEAVADIISHVCLVHLSDTTSAAWRHAAVGEGDVDFQGLARKLDALDYSGPSVMEIVDLENPSGALTSSAEQLNRWGWVW